MRTEVGNTGNKLPVQVGTKGLQNFQGSNLGSGPVWVSSWLSSFLLKTSGLLAALNFLQV